MEQSQKNNKDFLYVISLLLVTIILMSLGFMFWKKDNKDNTLENKQSQIADGKILTEDDIVELMDGPYEATTTDQLVFNVMQNTAGPKMTKVIIAPQKVSRGEEQYLEVWVKDDQGVQSVQTITELDRGIVKELDMELFAGDTKNGKWRVSWVVHDTHDETYNTKFIATSIDKRISDVEYGWLDPCSPPLTGDWLVDIATTCDEGGIVGTENGDIIIDKRIILSNTSLVFNPTHNITLGTDGEISLCPTCKIEKAYMVVRDPDADGQFALNASQNLITATTTSFDTRGTVQGKWIGGVWYTAISSFKNITNPAIPMGGDCYEADTDGARNTFAGQTQVFAVSNGNATTTLGQFDYNCDGTVTGGLADDNSGAHYAVNTFQDYSWTSSEAIPPGACVSYTNTEPDSLGNGCGAHLTAITECSFGIGQNSSGKFISFLQKHFFSVLIHPVLAVPSYDAGFFKGNDCSGGCVGNMYVYCY